MKIWQFNNQLASRLMNWNILNLLVGLLLQRGSTFWRGFGSQNIGWSVINLAISFGGSWFTQRRFDALDNPYDAAVQQREAQNLRRILWLNAFLDVLYVTGGGWLARSRGQDKPFWRGMGRGIMLQGVLLFVFDVLHARQLPD